MTFFFDFFRSLVSMTVCNVGTAILVFYCNSSVFYALFLQGTLLSFTLKSKPSVLFLLLQAVKQMKFISLDTWLLVLQ